MRNEILILFDVIKLARWHKSTIVLNLSIKKIIIANKRSYKTKKLKNVCSFFVLWLKVAHNQHLYDKTMFCAILPQILVLEYSFTAKIFWFFFVIVNVGISHNNNKYGYIITTMAFILTIGMHTKLAGIRKKNHTFQMICAAATAISYFPWFAFHLKEFVKCIHFGHAILICCEVLLNLLAILGWIIMLKKNMPADIHRLGLSLPNHSFFRLMCTFFIAKGNFSHCLSLSNAHTIPIWISCTKVKLDVLLNKKCHW